MRHIYIDGQWVTGTGATLDAISPDDLRVLGAVPLCRENEIEAAVHAAQAALPGWRAVSLSKRVRLVAALADSLVEEYGGAGSPSELKALIGTETGKRLPEADNEVIESSDVVRYFAAIAENALAPEKAELDDELWPTKTSRIFLSPRGVVAVVKPWNYPLEAPLWSIPPALVSGNTIVFKPSEHSSLVGLYIARLVEAAGFPSGVFNVITGDGETGRLLVSHPNIDMVSFTGSVETGRSVAKVAATNLIPCSLELGGNDAAIVLADADLELAANGIAWGAICNSGQVCVGVKRILAVEAICSELIDRLTKVIEQLTPGVDYGPLISDTQLASAERFIADAVSKGANLRIGGVQDKKQGPLYLTPALLTEVPFTADLAQSECFGPVAPVFCVKDADDAVRAANDTRYGLGASVWTRSRDEFRRLADELDVGMVWENDVCIAWPQAPWAGRRQSGLGCDLSKWGLFEYVQPKHLSFEGSIEKRHAWWYPYGQQRES